jgi:Transposase/Transposase IS116/IS110/IS902 family
MIFVGVDWAEVHHDVTVLDAEGAVLGNLRIPDTIEGVGRLHAMVAEHSDDPSTVIVGIETPAGLLPQALRATGYELYAINPKAASRYRERHSLSGAKSDAGDSKMLADLVRTDRHNHRRSVGDSELAAAIAVLARSHKELIWQRQRQVNQLRSALRQYYPAILTAFDELGAADALMLLQRAPTPAEGRDLSVAKVRSVLERAGRRKRLDEKAQTIQQILRRPHLEAPPLVARAHGLSVRALVSLIQAATEQIAGLESELVESFEAHPDAEVIRSLPGLGAILGARVLGEFGDEPTRFADGKARKNYAGTSPITKASGTKRVVQARYARNAWLADACDRWAFCSLTRSPGARAYYDALRARRQDHHQALRMLANRWVGILHGCLRHRCGYVEEIGWAARVVAA